VSARERVCFFREGRAPGESLRNGLALGEGARGKPRRERRQRLRYSRWEGVSSERNVQLRKKRIFCFWKRKKKDAKRGRRLRATESARRREETGGPHRIKSYHQERGHKAPRHVLSSEQIRKRALHSAFFARKEGRIRKKSHKALTSLSETPGDVRIDAEKKEEKVGGDLSGRERGL